MPRGNPQNLRTPTSEEAREIGRRGGLASAKSRQRHRQFREIIKDVMASPLDGDDSVVKKLEELGMQANFENAIMLMAAYKAKEGDIEAIRFLRDTIGEKPTEQYNLSVSDKPIQALNLADYSDQQLLEMADKVADLPPTTD